MQNMNPWNRRIIRMHVASAENLKLTKRIVTVFYFYREETQANIQKI